MGILLVPRELSDTARYMYESIRGSMVSSEMLFQIGVRRTNAYSDVPHFFIFLLSLLKVLNRLLHFKHLRCWIVWRQSKQ